MDHTGRGPVSLRVLVLSALSAFAAPLVLVGIVVLRKGKRRFNFHFRSWNRRLQREMARWG